MPRSSLNSRGLRAHHFFNSRSGSEVRITRKLGEHCSGASGAPASRATSERRARTNSPASRVMPATSGHIGTCQRASDSSRAESVIDETNLRSVARSVPVAA